MRYKVNENCVGCGLCTSTCPEVFSMTQEGYARAASGEVDGALEESARQAADACPVSAIESEP